MLPLSNYTTAELSEQCSVDKISAQRIKFYWSDYYSAGQSLFKLNQVQLTIVQFDNGAELFVQKKIILSKRVSAVFQAL